MADSAQPANSNSVQIDIAARVRELRELRDFTLAALAEKIDISEELLQKYETGQVSIPASELNDIAITLGVDLGLLLTGEAPNMRYFAITRKGQGAAVNRRQGYGYESLASNFKNTGFEPFLVTLPPTDQSVPIPENTHPGQEFNYLLSGRMIVRIHGNSIILSAGDSIVFDATEPHGMKALDNQPARFLAIIDNQ